MSIPEIENVVGPNPRTSHVTLAAFRDLNQLEKGDGVYVTDANGKEYTYEVFRGLRGGRPHRR